MFARREIVKGAAVLPLAAVLADPVLAAAAAASTETAVTKLANGKEVIASVAYPEVTPAPAIMLIHEWWGLNDQIKAVGAELAKAGYVAVSVDLYNGNVGTTADEARKYMQAVKPDEATETLEVWANWTRNNKKTTDKLGTIGWCFGGGWSLNASIVTPVDATIVYYGSVDRKADQLRSLVGPVMGHFASRDQWITREMVNRFIEQMKLAEEPAPQVFWYEADHAFANPSGGRYDKEDTQLAWSRSMEFFNANLKG